MGWMMHPQPLWIRPCRNGVRSELRSQAHFVHSECYRWPLVRLKYKFYVLLYEFIESRNVAEVEFCSECMTQNNKI